MSRLTEKNVKFKWTEESQWTFGKLREEFIMVSVLAYFDWICEVVVEMDASDWVITSVFSQLEDNRVLHPISFNSKKHSPAEENYEIYNKELMGIVRVFEEWLVELESVESLIQVLSYHKNEEYFMSISNLSRQLLEVLRGLLSCSPLLLNTSSVSNLFFDWSTRSHVSHVLCVSHNLVVLY